MPSKIYVGLAASSKKVLIKKAIDFNLTDVSPRPPKDTGRKSITSSGLRRRSAYNHFLIEEFMTEKSNPRKFTVADRNQTLLNAKVFAENGRKHGINLQSRIQLLGGPKPSNVWRPLKKSLAF